MNLFRLKKKLKDISKSLDARVSDDVVFLSGEVGPYPDVVKAGMLAAKLRCRGVVNQITCLSESPEPMRVPEVSDKSLEGKKFDVVIIGAGVVGCAIARELSLRNLSVAILEKEYDVGVRTSSRNDGMIHPGIDLHANQLKTRFNCLGNRMYTKLSEDLGFKFIRNGSYVILDKWWELITVPFFFLRAKRNKIDGISFVSRKKLKTLQSSVADWQKGAIYLPSSGIVQPYEVTVALAENAADNKAAFFFETVALSLEKKDGLITEVNTNRGTVRAKVVVNAAGVYSDVVAAMADDQFFSIHPRKGTELILDRETSKITESVLAKVPFSDVKQHTKGGGVVRTIDGNILIGPDAHETIQREDDSTELRDINEIIQKHQATVPELNKSQIITYFSGTRASTYEEDFIVEVSRKVDNLVHAAGIQSPGLTAAPAIAADLAEKIEVLFKDLYNQEIHVREDAILRREAPVVMSQLDLDQRDKLITQDPDFGQIVCRCEEISKAEILRALRSSLPVYNIDAIKRRCRAGMGRCQGGFCSPLVASIISEELGIPLDQVKKGTGNFLKGRVKEVGV